MNDHPSMNKDSLDAVNVTKDLSALLKDGVFQSSKMEEKVGQPNDKSKGDLTIWVEDGASQFSRGFEKLKVNLKKKVVDAMVTVKKGIGYGSGPYRSKAQKVADQVLSSIRKKAFRHPWAAISTALAVGFLLGSLIRPTRKVMKLFK